jgi:hypothetical protein
MRISPEEFFMVLTMLLIVLIPVSVRLYRCWTAGQVKRMLEKEFAAPAASAEKTNKELRP